MHGDEIIANNGNGEDDEDDGVYGDANNNNGCNDDVGSRYKIWKTLSRTETHFVFRLN